MEAANFRELKTNARLAQPQRIRTTCIDGNATKFMEQAAELLSQYDIHFRFLDARCDHLDNLTSETVSQRASVELLMGGIDQLILARIEAMFDGGLTGLLKATYEKGLADGMA